jgi:hypothetical protein
MARRLYGLLELQLMFEHGLHRKILTLSKDEVVLLNETLEVVRLELLDVGSSNNGRKESGANSRVLHIGVFGGI